jgi:hypothetical protein
MSVERLPRSNSAFDSSNQKKERENRRSKYSTLIKYAHHRLVEEGSPKDYIMTENDVMLAMGLDVTPKELRRAIRTIFDVGSVQEMLSGLGLPNDYKERY